MSDDEFDDEPEDLDVDELDEDVLDDADDDFDDDLLEEDEEDEDAIVVAVDVDEDDGESELEGAVALEEEEDDIVDLDEELHPDDVEEALDVVLRERTAAAGLEEDEDEEEEPDERGEGGTKIVPRRPDKEFLCQSCFLVLPMHQLADKERMYCRDCA
jgi:hypothetical protein